MTSKRRPTEAKQTTQKAAGREGVSVTVAPGGAAVRDFLVAGGLSGFTDAREIFKAAAA